MVIGSNTPQQAAVVGASSGNIGNFFGKGVLELNQDFSGVYDNIKSLQTNAGNIGKVFSDQTPGVAKLSAAVGALTGVASASVFAVLNVASAFQKFSTIKDVIVGVSESYQKFVGVSKTLDFAEAVTGSKELTDNFKILQETSDNFFNRATTAAQVLFDNASYKQWSLGAIKAYASVETAAFKLATITTTGEESALKAINARIRAVRDLQKETNFAVGSVEALNLTYEAASAGFTSRNASQAVSKSAIDLSQVGFGDVADTGQGLVKILSANRAAGDSFQDAGKRASQLFSVTKVGITTLNQLNSEMAQLTSVASASGIAFEDVAAALALVTTQGLSTAEGSTSIQALINEIVNNLPKAQDALATFRDNAGRPIQFGFGALKEEGLLKLIQRLGEATGGSKDALNKVFSSIEAGRAATALIQSGSDKANEFAKEINFAGSEEGQDKFQKSAKERGQTLEGSFNAARNSTKAAVETFGEGAAEGTLDNLRESNVLLAKFATATTSSFGSFIGFIDVASNKVSALAGAVGTVFTVVAPLAFFAVVFSQIKRTGLEFAKAFQPGDGSKTTFVSVFQKIEQEIIKLIASVLVKTEAMVKNIKEKLNEVKAEGGALLAEPKQLGLDLGAVNTPDVVKETGIKKNISKNIRPDFGPLPDSQLALPLGVQSTPVAKPAIELPKAENAVQSATKKAGTAASDLLNSVKTQAAGAGNILKGVGGFIGNLGKEIATFAVSTGLVGAAIFLATTLVTGLVKSVNALSNPTSLQTVKDLRSEITSLGNNIPSLERFNLELDTLGQKARDADAGLSLLAQTGQFFGQLLNSVGGNATENDVFQRISASATNLAQTDTAKTLEANKQGNFRAVTGKEKLVAEKIRLGIELDENDIKSVKDATEKLIANEAFRLKQLQIAIDEERSKGGFGSDGRAQAKEKELAKQKEFSKEAIKENEEVKKRTILTSQLKKIQAFSADTPLGTTAITLFNQSADSQLEQLKKKFKDVFSVGTGDLSKIDITAFDDLFPALQSQLQTLQIQADLDPTQALEGLRKLTQDANVAQFTASNPAAIKALDEAARQLTEKQIARLQTLSGAYTKLNQTLLATGANLSAASGEATAKGYEAVNEQINVLFNRLETADLNAQDYAKTLSGIADLQAQAFQIKKDGQIKEELDGRKQQLTLNQSILDVQKQTIDLFSQESKFGSLSVSLAQAKLVAAERELAVKKESVAITTREDEITKESTLEAAKNNLLLKETILQNIVAKNKLTAAEVAGGNKTIVSGIERQATKVAENQIGAKEKELGLANTNLQGLQKQREQGITSLTEGQRQTLRQALFDDENAKFLNNPIISKGSFDRDNNRDDADFTPAGRQRIADERLNELVDKDNNINLSKLRQTGLTSTNEDVRTLVFEAGFKELDAKIASEKKTIAELEPATTSVKETSKANVRTQTDVVNNLGLDSARKVVEQAEKDLKFTQVANRVKNELSILSETIARNEARINLAYAEQERLIAISQGVGESFSKLGSAASTVFSSSAIGSTFTRIGATIADKTGTALSDASKEVQKITSRLSTLTATRDRTVAIANEAKKQGVNSPDLQKAAEDITKQTVTAQKEAARDLAFVRQKTVVDGLSATLEKFGAIAANSSDILSKLGESLNNRIELQGRREGNVGESNAAVRGFSTAQLRLFGNGNPGADAAVFRSEFAGREEETILAQNSAVRAGQKELNTLSIQEQQLQTELQMYTNALTQTQLLTLLVSKISPETGIALNPRDTDALSNQVNQIPAQLKSFQDFTENKLATSRETQAVVRSEVDTKVNTIGLNNASKQLASFTENPFAGGGSADLLQRALANGNQFRNNLGGLQNVQRIALDSPDFIEGQSRIKGIGASTRNELLKESLNAQNQFKNGAIQTRKDFEVAAPKPVDPGSTKASQQVLTINIRTNITAGGGASTSLDNGNIQDIAKGAGITSGQVQSAIDQFTNGFAELGKRFATGLGG